MLVMRTALACCLLALLSWAAVVIGARRDAALVFAVVWTVMAAAYAPRAWRNRGST